jgi:hypothetical protein
MLFKTWSASANFLNWLKTKKMKIIQILNSPNWSGASNYCISVTTELINLGHRVLLITEPGKPAFKAEQAGIEIDTSIRLNHRNPLLYFHAMKRMKQIFRRFQPDIISAHINEGAWMSGMLARKFAPEAVVSRVRTEAILLIVTCIMSGPIILLLVQCFIKDCATKFLTFLQKK